MDALIVTGGEGPALPVLEGLASSADFIVAADSGLDVLAETSFSPDYIVGDFDSLQDKALLRKYAKAHIMKYPRDKDATDTEIALDLCFAKGALRVTIAGGAGGRLDHALGILYLFKRDLVPQAWHGRSESLFYLQAGNSGWFKTIPGATVSVFPLMEASEGMASKGLKWPLAGLCWKAGDYGISNVAVGDEISIKAGSSALLVILPSGAECLSKNPHGSPGILDEHLFPT
jgi:thiamine pyrophosphokinase